MFQCTSFAKLIFLLSCNSIKGHAEAVDDASGGLPHKDFGPHRSTTGSQLSSLPLLKTMCTQIGALYGAAGLNDLDTIIRRSGSQDGHTLNLADLGEVLRLFAISVTHAQIAQLFSTFDRDGSGLIDRAELLRGLRSAGNGVADVRLALIDAACPVQGEEGVVGREELALGNDPASLALYMDSNGMDMLSAADFKEFFLNVSALSPMTGSFAYVLCESGLIGAAEVCAIRRAHTGHVAEHEEAERVIILLANGKQMVETVPVELLFPPQGLEEAMKEHMQGKRGLTVCKVELL